MIRVTGVGRRMLLVAVGLSAVALGWVLLFEVTSPGVAAKLPTGPLAVVLALQVLPVLAWMAWRADRASQASEPAQAVAGPSPADLEASPATALPIPLATPQPGAERLRVRNDQVMPVHRVTHMPRSRSRVTARATDQAVAG